MVWKCPKCGRQEGDMILLGSGQVKCPACGAVACVLMNGQLAGGMDIPFANRLTGEIAREMREREQITCPHRAECNWSSPDRCAECQGENKTGVLAVNQQGVKHGLPERPE